MNDHQATKNEYDKLVEIWARSVKKTHDFLQIEDFERIKRDLPTYFPHLDVRVWTDDSEIIGFSGVDGDKLEMLFLDPIFIGKGYGKQIIMTLFKDSAIQFVDVNEQNQSARTFYQAMGFEEMARTEVDEAGRPYPILHLKKRDHFKLSNSEK
ncbi:hypothetical protein A5821_001860 [Enterococcus sp. 7F3_DIV0205]|uniref:N-acetyltransferase domain-containing protein n=1 Tax=Candidatus Enterococcus palustris TaxID=1834189 RepID=A0AAQ3Y682_9ENTE|nr:GNAT family N-acetyltransferase [Enterococcus sp. 7F3_DIV0205]OTN86248.1 hypothetical protein A5821_002198 [Enterococcus sp. 7F3_DIV0205]